MPHVRHVAAPPAATTGNEHPTDRRRIKGRQGISSGLRAARERALGLASPEPHQPGAPPPQFYKPSRIGLMAFGDYAMRPQPQQAPARIANASANAARVASERAALFGQHASDVAAGSRTPPDAA